MLRSKNGEEDKGHVSRAALYTTRYRDSTYTLIGHGALPIWELLSEADGDGRPVGQDAFSILYPLAIDDGHTFEEVFQLYDVLLDC